VILNGRDPAKLTEAGDAVRSDVPGAAVSGQPAETGIVARHVRVASSTVEGNAPGSAGVQETATRRRRSAST
jgi:hypothetical protein